MKRCLALLLCVMMVVALAACSDAEGSTPSQKATEVKNEAVVDNNITDTNDMVAVETSIGNLYYPAKWTGVAFTVGDTQVDAAYGDTKLFTLYFGGKEGDIFGTLTDDDKTELRYEMYDIDSKTENFDDLCAMQDDINVIFQYLIQEEKLEEAI